MEDKKLLDDANAAFEAHIPLRPWIHNILQIVDANGRQILHVGGQNNSDRKRNDAYWLTGLAAYIVKCVNFPPLGYRKLNSMFHVNQQLQLVKTTNNDPVPDDEPLFILRGRDALSEGAILRYIDHQIDAGVPEDRIAACRESLVEFKKFKLEHADRMKNPGITHGR